MRIYLIVVIVLSGYLLSGCVPNSIVAKNARHLSLQFAAHNHDINSRDLITDNQHSAEKFLQQFYDLGKKDHKEGLTQSEAQARVLSLKKAHAFDQSSQKSWFINRKYDSTNPAVQANLILDSAIKTYWDGYNGVR